MQISSPIAAMAKTEPIQNSHLAVLDGWRGLSILFVLACHLLPLGPKAWQVNVGTGILGMVLFFNLSGFLITSFLLSEQNVIKFLIRRFFRIIPLAWLYLLIALTVTGASGYVWVSHLLFFANLPPKSLFALTDHFWSLCVEMQFYVGIAILVALLRRRGLFLLPFLCILFTAFRVWDGMYYSTFTYYRIDEILVGCTLALIYKGHLGTFPQTAMKRVPFWPVTILLLLSCMPQSTWLNYFRPYFAACLIGKTLLDPATRTNRMLSNEVLIFLATISYSLYVIHPMLAASWLGSGDVVIKYVKRPLLFAVLFTLAWLSTHFYEKRFMDLGKQLSNRLSALKFFAQ
jgi:peptidoglycan/LPS O-acetylase OafA/YrhL